AVLDERAKLHPDNETVIDLAKKDLADTTDFVRAKGFVSMPAEPIEVTPWPEYSRGVAVASCNPPGALEKNGKTYFYISPTPADWPAKRVESFFREYNDDMLKELTIHEAMPGHYLQLAHANRFRAPTFGARRGLFRHVCGRLGDVRGAVDGGRRVRRSGRSHAAAEDALADDPQRHHRPEDPHRRDE